MFFKLLKHNLKAILKSILPFIIFLLTATIMMNITSFDYELGYIEIAGAMSQTVLDPPAATAFWNGLAQFLIYISIILLLATTVRANWRRFSNNFYSDEAYLTHTLPVSRNMLWGSMIASTLISIITVILVLVCCGFLLTLSVSGQRFLDSFGLLGGCVKCFNEYYSLAPRELSFYLSYSFILFTELAFITLCSITGIILGHRSTKNLSLISGIAIYLLGSALLVGIFLLLAKLDVDISQLYEGIPINTPGYSPTLGYVTRALFYISTVYSCYCLVLYFVDQKLLRHGINLD